MYIAEEYDRELRPSTFIGTVDSGQSTGGYIPLTLLTSRVSYAAGGLTPPYIFAAPVVYTVSAVPVAFTVPVILVYPDTFAAPLS